MWLSLTPNKNTKHKWHDDDVAIIAMLAGTMPKEDIARHMGIKLPRLTSKAFAQKITLAYPPVDTKGKICDQFIPHWLGASRCFACVKRIINEGKQ